MKVGIFHLRSCHAGGAYVDVFPRMTQQAFLEGHVGAFAYFGGAFALMRYDNLASAVKKVLKGRRRIESDRFVALRSHYGFESQFTLVGIRGAHEKGGVESEVGRFRRRHLVPVPRVDSFGELREYVRAAMTRDLSRRIAGRPETVTQALERGRGLLRALPREPHPTHESLAPRVDAKALVSVGAVRYSVPVALVGRRVGVELSAREVLVRHDGREVARHERVHARGQMVACLDHYLDLLRVKPGALAGSIALHQEREGRRWPRVLDELWRRIAERYSEAEAARQMVEVLLLAREVGPERMVEAACGALAAGAHDARAVALLARMSPRESVAPLEDLPEHLAATARPEPDLDEYDALLGSGGRA